MALIPSDIGIRMRLQNEASLLQPLSPVHEIPSDLPELRTGQTFSARIQEVLPDNTYKALVAGKQLTLQLPEGAKPGDQLELVVIDRSVKVVIAKQVEGAAPAAAETGPYPFAKFSPAARMIGNLLPAEGTAPPPAQLNRGQPLLAQPPQTQGAATLLAPTLEKAVTQSGMFYESHQAQWVTGKLPLAQLLQEPQGKLSQPQAFVLAAQERLAAATQSLGQPQQQAAAQQTLLAQPQAAAQQTLLAQPQAAAQQTLLAQPQAALQLLTPANLPALIANINAENPSENKLPVVLPGQPAATSTNPATANPVPTLQANPGEKFGASGTANNPANPAQAAPLSQQVPDELRPLVQQQLEAVATQRMFWHGEVWPQQPMDWEIERDGRRESGSGEEDGANWRTALSLTTPRLGRIDAKLQLATDGVRITLATPYGASAADLRDAAPKLAEALAAAGVPLLALNIKHEDEYPAGQG